MGIKSYLKKRILRYLGIYDLVERYNPGDNQFNIIKGDNVYIGKNSTVIDCKFGNNNRIGDSSYLYNVEYGDFCYNSLRTTIMNCKIGNFCSIAQDVKIGLGKHPLENFVSTHPAFYSVHKQCGYSFAKSQFFNEMGSVTIGNDVWIGVNAVILDDVKIGDGAVIAANSLVNNDVPPYAVVGGTPARVIKYRFSDEEIKILLDVKWWNKESDWFESNYELFHDRKVFFEKFSKE